MTNIQLAPAMGDQYRSVPA